MKSSTKDIAKGKFHEAKGTMKEAIGARKRNPRMQDDGTDEKIAGKIQKTVGRAKRALGA